MPENVTLVIKLVWNLSSEYLPIIVLYQPSVKSSTCLLHIHFFVKLKSCRQKYTLTLEIVVKSPACILYSMEASGLYFSCLSILLLDIVEIQPVSNDIQNCLYLCITCHKFMQPYIMVE